MVNDPGVYGKLVRSKSIAFGQTYGERDWETDDLATLLRIVARDIGRADPLRRRLAPFLLPFQRLGSLRMLNTRAGSRSNIARHYDLGNEMFELFLDREAMMYSSAYYETGTESLERAQHTRLERICDSLELRPSDHLLEIGTGWGGMAVHAASTRGCRVTTTTISREQREYAEARVIAAGLEDLVTIAGADYRDLRGSYDKLVSLEMIEAVGWEWFDTYFRHCSELLDPHRPLLPAGDRDHRPRLRDREADPELRQPGGLPGRLPALGRIDPELGRRADRPPHRRPRGHLLQLRAHPARLARALPGGGEPGSRSSATTSASGGSGPST